MERTNQANRIVQVFLAALLLIAAGCSTTGTSMNHVWKDSDRGDVPLGRTLVLALFTGPAVSIPVEHEWTRQLRNREIEAEAANTLLAGDYPPDKERAIELVETDGFDTLLICRLVKTKTVSRDASHYQTAVVETVLYDTRTRKPFWTARSDTFMVSGAGNQVRKHQDDKLRMFVETVIQEMSSSRLF